MLELRIHNIRPLLVAIASAIILWRVDSYRLHHNNSLRKPQRHSAGAHPMEVRPVQSVLKLRNRLVPISVTSSNENDRSKIDSDSSSSPGSSNRSKVVIEVEQNEAKAGNRSSALDDVVAVSAAGEKLKSPEWARKLGMEPGFGGYWPGDPNAKRHKVTIRGRNSGVEHTLMVPEDRYIFFYFEEQGIDLPMINKHRMCRQGCCTVCTAKLEKGKVKMDTPLGLLKDMRKQGYILTCCAYPRGEEDLVMELQDEDEMYVKQWGESFEGGGVEWGGVLIEDD